MKDYQIYKHLAALNELTADEARQAFLNCCGSSRWSERMEKARPYRMVEDLFSTAERVWQSLSPGDWLEAFAAHPKIGSSGPSPKQGKSSAEWSRNEQSGVESADDTTKEQLRLANRLYEERFGFIFIVCATGRSAEEMLAVCRARLGNSPQTELWIAADEQRKITEIRLAKLLEK